MTCFLLHCKLSDWANVHKSYLSFTLIMQNGGKEIKINDNNILASSGTRMNVQLSPTKSYAHDII